MEEKKENSAVVKKMANIHFWTKKTNLAIISMLRQNGWSIEKVATKKIGVTKKTLIGWAKESPELRKALWVSKMIAITIADTALREQAQKGNVEALKYYLRHNRRSIYDDRATGLDDELEEKDDAEEFFEEVGIFDMFDEGGKRDDKK